ncbi:MAG: DUF962 domain-containing protein [Bacteriovoracaceae bacterium]|nr:DUF962 domain-containing protein [Bacteriovoracaceae bacterium]
MEKKYKTFKEFYPFYLSEHAHPVNRLLHFIGTTLALSLIICAFLFKAWTLIILALISGYAFAWIGHFVIEKNRPATFTYPLYSFVGDWKMFFEILTFKRGLKD